MASRGASSRGVSSRSSATKKTSATRTQASKTSVKSDVSVSSVASQRVVSKKTSKVVVSQPPKTQKEFTGPAYSLPYVRKVTETEIDKLKKRAIRRNAPPGEDLKGIKEILKTIRGQQITVQEFIRLIGPSTGDNGECLRVVMNDDLACFRKLARKVYDMITQDNSDVLLNQQLQLSEYYQEKKTLLNTKMMTIIEQIYEMAPNFDFDRYAAEGQAYLAAILPIPEELKVEPEEMEMMRRQAAFHRLHWLQSEGERLHQENNSLKKRLTEMKRLHMQEQMKMTEMEKVAEEKKETLEATQAEKEETLEILNQSLEKSIIKQEMSIRQTQETAVASSGPSKATGAIRKTKSKTGMKKPRRPKWNEAAASEIEGRLIEESKQSEIVKTRKCRKERSPFHFSPIKTPPQGPAPKELSPFHFSPPKTPPRAPRSPFHFSPVKTPPRKPPTGETSPFHYSPGLPPPVTRPRRPPAPPQEPAAAKGRRGYAPRDSWGGFY